MTVAVNDRLTLVGTTAGQTYVETDFRVDLKEYLVVVRRRDGEVLTLELDVDYTISQLGDDEGCRVTFTPDPALEGDEYLLLGALPVARTSSFVSLGGVSAASLDTELDAFARQLQEMNREVARSFKAEHFGDGGFDLEGRRIQNVGDPIDEGDAVNKRTITSQLNAATAAATAQSGQNAEATAADRVQTGFDRAATAADRVQTGLDRAAAAVSAAHAASSEAAALGQLGIGRLAHVGDIKFQTTRETPQGWRRLKRDPQALSKAEFPELNAKYAADGYPYGSTSTHFNIPGVAGLFLRPWDDEGTHDPGAASRLTHAGAPGGGNVIGSRQASQNLAHDHGGATGNDIEDHTHNFPDRGAGPAAAGNGIPTAGSQDFTRTTGGRNGFHRHTISPDGGSEGRPVNVAFPLIILVNPTEASAAHTPFGLPYVWSSGTADADPGTGKLRLNDGTFASATAVYVSKRGSNAADFAPVWALSDAIAADVRAVLTLYNAGAPNNVIIASITGAIVDGGEYVKVPISVLTAAGTFTAGAPLCAQIGLTAGGPQGEKGKEGDPGPQGDPGWTAVYAIASDGTRRVQKVVDWLGGEGEKPAADVYVGADGFVEDIADAIDIRGPAGDGAGDVVGPGVAVIGNLPTFGNTDGTALVDSGKAISIDGTLASNSDAKLPTEKAVKTYCDALIAANDAMVFKGVIDCSANPSYPGAERGYTYRVSVAGKIGGGAGPNVEVGDILLCLTDDTPAGNHATIGAQWGIIQVNIDGALTTQAIGVTVQPYDAALFAGLPYGNAKSADYTAVLADANTIIAHSGADNNARTFTIPADASVPFPANSFLGFHNGVNMLTIAPASGVTLMFIGSGAIGSRMLAANGLAIALRVSTNLWLILGVGLS